MQEKMSSTLIGNQILTQINLDNKLKHFDVLKDTLMPFILIIDDNGIILSAGSGLNKMAKKNIESMHVNDIIEFNNPNKFDDLKKVNNNSLIKYKLVNSTIYIKASNYYYK